MSSCIERTTTEAIIFIRHFPGDIWFLAETQIEASDVFFVSFISGYEVLSRQFIDSVHF